MFRRKRASTSYPLEISRAVGKPPARFVYWYHKFIWISLRSPLLVLTSVMLAAEYHKCDEALLSKHQDLDWLLSVWRSVVAMLDDSLQTQPLFLRSAACCLSSRKTLQIFSRVLRFVKDLIHHWNYHSNVRQFLSVALSLHGHNFCHRIRLNLTAKVAVFTFTRVLPIICSA